METYRCAYRDPHSPLAPLTPVSDVSLRETLRDHSPSLMPINKIVLDKCPPPKRKRPLAKTQHNTPTEKHRPNPVKIVVSSEKTPPEEGGSKGKLSYLQNLKRILTPNSRPTPKSMDFAPVAKRSRFSCFPKFTNDVSVPMSPRVLRILEDIGQDKYTDIFRKEEIDLDVFKILTKRDLMKLGVQEEKDIPVILNAISLVQNR